RRATLTGTPGPANAGTGPVASARWLHLPPPARRDPCPASDPKIAAVVDVLRKGVSGLVRLWSRYVIAELPVSGRRCCGARVCAVPVHRVAPPGQSSGGVGRDFDDYR